MDETAINAPSAQMRIYPMVMVNSYSSFGRNVLPLLRPESIEHFLRQFWPLRVAVATTADSSVAAAKQSAVATKDEKDFGCPLTALGATKLSRVRPGIGRRLIELRPDFKARWRA
jgi:hypothetical protein